MDIITPIISMISATAAAFATFISLIIAFIYYLHVPKDSPVDTPEDTYVGGASFREYCDSNKKFKLQPQQRFVSRFMSPGTHNDELLLFHKIGSGKTCAAIQIASKWTSRGRPLVIMPASLIPGFYNELRSPCGSYLTGAEREELDAASPVEYKKLVTKYNSRIDKDFIIMSYNKFLSEGDPKTPIVIIDEIQNVDGQKSKFYKKMISYINRHKVPIALLSGTPIFDNPSELTSIARLLRIEGDITVKSIPTLFKNKVSYYPGAPAFTFPTVTKKIRKCQMSTFQASWYIKQIEAEERNGKIKLVNTTDNFYIKSRQKANVVYPNGVSGGSLTSTLIRSSLGVYSTKMERLVKTLKRGRLSFIYTNFTGPAGCAMIARILTVLGWKNLHTEGPGKRRFAIWSGEQTGSEKDMIRRVYNSVENDNASQLQVIIGSPAIKEGVSLLRCRDVHILETYWNHSRLEQIYGRAVRYCSHKRLTKENRTVTIYIYCAVVGSASNRSGGVTPKESIDLYMLNMADEKEKAAAPYAKALVNVAVDYGLYN